MSPALTLAVGRGLAGEDCLQAVLRINSPTRLWSIASLPPPCTNLFLQHLGSIVSAKFAQHSAFFIPADFLFLLAHFSLALILYFLFFFSPQDAAAVRRETVSAFLVMESLAGAAVPEMPLVVRSWR